MKRLLFTAAALLAGTTASSSSWACSSCGCFLNSDWASQGFTVGSGLRFDVRYDYFNQDQLRSGTRSFNRDGVVFPVEREIQQSTINRNLNLALDYSPNQQWGVNVLLPVFDRPHATIAEGDDAVSRSHSRSVGDVRVLGRYQGAGDDASGGLQFGVKLPTGRINDVFSDGPQAGSTVDRGLQPGTGTTDALIGLYRFGALGENTSYFANILAQLPLNSRDRFRPGPGITASVGVRTQTANGIEPQLQINVRTERRESGVNADVDNSGATLVNLSPGVTMPLSKQTLAYAFVQLPVYQRVNGLQIEPRFTISIGLRWSL